MAIPAPEYRERLLEQGCDEGLADVVLALVEAARDDAEAEVIIKAGEQIAHSEQRLNGRLDQHAEQNDRQFRDVAAEIRETAIETTRTLTAQIEQRTAQLLQSAAEQRAETERWRAETDQRVAKLDERLTEMRVENERQFTEMRVENERQFTEMRVENERQFAELRIENERGRRENAEAFSKTQNRLSYVAIGIATLIIGAAAAIIAAFAFIA